MKSLKIIILIFTAITYSLQINAIDSKLQEEFRTAIQQNNLLKVQNFLNNKDIDVNFIYSDNKNPFYISLENLESKAKKSFWPKIIGSIVTGLITIGSLKTANDDIEKLNDAKQLSYSDLKERLNRKENFLAAKALKLKSEPQNPKRDADLKETAYNLIEIINFKESDFLTYQKTVISNKSSDLRYDFLEIIGFLAESIWLGCLANKVKKEINTALEIVTLISNNLQFKQDQQSTEFIEKKLPKYINLLESKRTK